MLWLDKFIWFEEVLFKNVCSLFTIYSIDSVIENHIYNINRTNHINRIRKTTDKDHFCFYTRDCLPFPAELILIIPHPNQSNPTRKQHRSQCCKQKFEKKTFLFEIQISWSERKLITQMFSASSVSWIISMKLKFILHYIAERQKKDERSFGTKWKFI